MNLTMATENDGPGASLLEPLLARPRIQLAHRLGTGLVLEAELRRDGRPVPVPFVLGYAAGSASGWTLTHAYAGASSVTVLADGSYLFLSDMRRSDRRLSGRAGRSIWRHQPGSPPDPELALSVPRGVASYTAAGSTAVAAIWGNANARSLAEDREMRPASTLSGQTATVLRGDLWPRSSCRTEDGEVLRLLRFPLDPGSAGPELLTFYLEPDVLLTGELALTPDGRRCAAGLVRFLRGGHRRHGLLLFPPADPGSARAVWASDDLIEAVAAPDSSWFACTAERVATPGRAPYQEVVLVASDGSRTLRAAPRHGNWLQPRAWAGPDALLCVGAENGQRHLWRVTPGAGRAERIELSGSVQAVTATAGEALVVRSGIDLPPEVVSLPLSEHLSGEPRPPGPCLLIAPAAAATPTGRMERLSYHAPDGSTWRSWLCLPEHDPGGGLPVLVWCHGGPLLSWTDWSWRWNPWPFVAEGYAVLMPDPPLSLGYGQDAVERGWGRWTSEVAAIAAAQIRQALAHPSLDPYRVAVMGGSFGGYLALALGTLLPEVRLIVSHAGWADFAAVARASDLHWHWLREYGPVDESPSYHAESLPLDMIDPSVRVLLSHGCDDTHVPVGEARAIYRSLDTRGMDVQLMLVPGEAHSIRRPANVAAWYRWVLHACHDVLRTQPARKEPTIG
jgi:acetyl esterase/lipase